MPPACWPRSRRGRRSRTDEWRRRSPEDRHRGSLRLAGSGSDVLRTKTVLRSAFAIRPAGRDRRAAEGEFSHAVRAVGGVDARRPCGLGRDSSPGLAPRCRRLCRGSGGPSAAGVALGESRSLVGRDWDHARPIVNESSVGCIVTTPLRLRIRNAEATGLEEEIREFTGPAIFGRSRDVDVLLLDPGISRRHASLRPGEDGGWLDRGSPFDPGTWVNGRRLAPGEISAIVEGDLVEINPWSLLVLGREATAGVVLDDGDVGGSIAEAVSDPAVARSLRRPGERGATGLDPDRRGGDLRRSARMPARRLRTRSCDDPADRGRGHAGGGDPVVGTVRGDGARARSPRRCSRPRSNPDGTVRLEEHPDVDQAQSFVARRGARSIVPVLRRRNDRGRRPARGLRRLPHGHRRRRVGRLVRRHRRALCGLACGCSRGGVAEIRAGADGWRR